MANTIENNSLALSTQMKDKLYEMGTIKLYKEGEIIMNENSYIRAIPIVLTGSIRVMRVDEEGREILLYYIRPGESCIMSFLGGIHSETSKVKAVAEEDVEILFIPIEKAGMLIKDNSEWLDYIFRLYHKRFEELLSVVNEVAFKKMDDRILHFLKEKQKLIGSNEIAITHQELSEELGTSRVVVSRLLKQMEGEGMVKLGRNKILLM
ncbi:MAG TPA: Crp/Fnr family transcriptional regulator [Flavipsychrobacter sp.]|nr:Crp/Fnr family transcriptional regulator [Chitinophagales bacterium]HLO71710.1 Crp/Fnr family transcriptional regulator [Flavipsychrobacter sp.]